MRSLAAIRTYRWGVEEDRLLEKLSAVFGDDVTIVFQNPPEGTALPVEPVPLTDAWIAAKGLRAVSDWGWRCGDYAYYALREARPGYDFYWLIEPDVFFTSDPRDFFESFVDDRTDALGYRAGKARPNVRFAKSLSHLEACCAIFAMTRLSGRLIDRLLVLRQSYSTQTVWPRDYANDEMFVFSHANAEPGFSVGRLEDRAPEWFHDAQFDPDPDILDTVASAVFPKGRVFHPVRSSASLKSALVKRLCGRTQFLYRMRPSLLQLDEEDLAEVVRQVAFKVREELDRVRREGTKEFKAPPADSE